MATKENDKYNRFLRKVSGYTLSWVHLHRDDVKLDWDEKTQTVARLDLDLRKLPGADTLPSETWNGKKPTVMGFTIAYGVAKICEDRTSDFAVEAKLDGRADVFGYLILGHTKNPNPKEKGAQTDWLAEAIASLQGVSVAEVQAEIKATKGDRKALAAVPEIQAEMNRLKAKVAATEVAGLLDRFTSK